MTYEEAKQIVNTYALPLNAEELREYREALKIIQGRAFIPPSTPEDE